MKARTAAIIAVPVLIAAVAGSLVLFWRVNRVRMKGAQGTTAAVISAPVPTPDRTEDVTVTPNATFGELLSGAGVSGADASGIYAAAKSVYDLANIRAGKVIVLRYAPDTGALKELVYPLNGDEELHVRREGGAWTAAKETIAYDVKVKTAKGTVTSSLYAAGLSQGLDERVIVGFADVFQWTVDFSQDVRAGDTFSVVYEERYRDGKYVMPGAILAAEYVNGGDAHRAYHFKDASGAEGYYDAKGASLRRMFLKAPVAFKYITSGFTTGARYVSAFHQFNKSHMAIDYAAAIGTPIRATADGTVAFAGWGGPYGNKITIRHNGTYSTNYCHQSRFAVKKGQHVVQGQLIGYVGTTGYSTGPHLHYEMVKNGVKINPLKEVFPGTDPVKETEMPTFQQTMDRWASQL